ncbi:metalloprotease [Patescibacteria group bacterium]
MEKRIEDSNLGIWVILAKLGPKILPVLSKMIKPLFGGKMFLAAASLGAYSFLFTWQMAVALVVFILVHEYGHLWAMKKCGIKTKGIYLIPGFGGAAVAAEGFKSARNEAYIALMGPLVGLVFIIPSLMLYYVTNNPMFAAISSIAALINLFNLFPVNPLDGGRVTKSIFHSMHSKAGLIFGLFSVILSIFLCFKLNLGLLAFIGLIGFTEILGEYGIKEKAPRLISVLSHLLVCLVGSFLIYTGNMFWMFAGSAAIAISFLLYMDKRGDSLMGKILQYPSALWSDFMIGSSEVSRVRLSDLTSNYQNTAMSNGQIVWYVFAYIATAGLMLAIMSYASGIPGCDLALEALR